MVKQTSNIIQRSFTYWTEKEHDLLEKAVGIHGTRVWSVIAAIVGTRSSTQCRSHYQKFEKRIQGSWLGKNEPVLKDTTSKTSSKSLACITLSDEQFESPIEEFEDSICVITVPALPI